MLLHTRWNERRALPRFGLLVATMTITILLYCWISPYSTPVPRVSIMTGTERTLFAKHAINNTVVIVPVNTGMLKMADNLLCSLSATTFDVKKIIFWALDEGAEEILNSRGFATFRDATLYGVAEDSNRSGNTMKYRRMMRERPKFFIDLLSTGYDVLMMDADLFFWQSPEVIIPDRNDIDIVYSTDAREFYQDKNAFRDVWRRGSLMPPVCNGLFWMKSSEQTIKIWRDMLDIFDAGWRNIIFQLIQFQDDQRGADYLLNDGRAQLVPPYPAGIDKAIVPSKEMKEDTLRVQLLDQTQVVNGHLLKNRRPVYTKNLAKLRKEGKDRIAAHFNWSSKELSKEDGAREFGMYLLDDDGTCVFNK